MNYIKTLQEQVTEGQRTASAVLAELDAFLSHLESDKFRGVQSDGERKDWIATSDVRLRLQEIRSLLR